MRCACWLVALASAACASTPPQPPRLAHAAPRDPVGRVVDGTQLADALVALEPDHVIRLMDLGWFQKVSAPERLAWFDEPPEPRIADDERTLFLGVAHPDDPPEKYPRVQMTNYSWAEKLGTHASLEVREQGFVTITHVGRFDAAAGRLWFFIDDELKHRLEVAPK